MLWGEAAPGASKGQGIEEQTLPALPVGAMMWELRPGAPNLLSLVQDKAHQGQWQQRHRPLARWERHILRLLLRVCKGCGGRRAPDSPGKPGLAAEPKESQPLLAMGGSCHTTFSKTEPSDTQTPHDVSGDCGSLLAAMVCFSGTVQGLRNLENELKTNKQQRAEGLQQSKEQNFSFFKLPGPRGEMMCPKHDKAPTGACLRTPRFPAFPRWEDLLNRLCHGNATFYSHFFLVFFGFHQ